MRGFGIIRKSIFGSMDGALPYAFRQRQGADYDALTVFEARAAADLIADVETFVRTVEAVLLPPDTSSTA